MTFFVHTKYKVSEFLDSLELDYGGKRFFSENAVLVGGIPCFNADKEIKVSNPGNIVVVIGGQEYKIKVEKQKK